MLFKSKANNGGNKNTLHNLYLANVTEYVNYSKKLVTDIPYDKDIQEYDVNCYNEAVSYIVEFLRSSFSEEQLSEGRSLNIDVDSLLKGTKNTVIYSIYEPQYRALIYIINETSYPHFHTDGKCILEAEGIECLPGLDYLLRKPKINKLFEGMEIKEARAMLKQMGLLPPGNNLEYEMDIYEKSQSIHRHFILSVVYSLLMSYKQSDVVRARLFANSFGVDFDFTPYEKDSKDNDKKLKKEQNVDC